MAITYKGDKTMARYPSEKEQKKESEINEVEKKPFEKKERPEIVKKENDTYLIKKDYAYDQVITITGKKIGKVYPILLTNIERKDIIAFKNIQLWD